MSTIAVESLDKNAIAELCCTYSALILHDEGLEITANQMNKLIESSGNKIDSFWPSIFAKALVGRNVNDLMCGGGAAAPVQQVGGENNKKEEEKKEVAKPVEEEEEEEDVDMGDLFGDF